MSRLVHPIIPTLMIFFVIGKPLVCRAQDDDVLETIPKAYSKDYIFLAMPYDRPVGESRSLYRAESVGAGLKYTHRLDSEWIVGLTVERKPFIGKDDRPLSMLVFSNQTQAIFRLYHPLYILAGTEVSYVMPVRKSSPPFAKDPDLSTEIAVGLNTSLWWLLSRKGTVELNATRWKGTKTSKLQGFEVSLGYGMGF